ncbi:MAG: ribosome maturation factor RimM [Nitrosomonas sp.]|nr:ribosome maturation factor RimM [Nitrosomonas sp.]
MVVMGHIIGPFGVQGLVKISPYTEHIDGLLGYSTWWLGKGDGQWREMEVTNGHVNGNTLTVKLSKCADRTEAVQFKGMQIAIPRSQLQNLSENGDDGYYWADLIGTTIINLQGEVLGKVTGLLETGANDVLQVQKPNDRERLIPYIDHVITEVDLKSLIITVDWSIDY